MKEEKEIELRSEEVQEILSRPPHSLVRWGITVFFVIIVLLFIGGCFFQYPDVVKAEATITTEHPPVWLVARNAGKLQEIYLPDRHQVKKAELIAVTENPAITVDVLLLKKKLSSFSFTDSCICQYDFPEKLSLGVVQGAYNSFVKSRIAYRDFILIDLYKQKEEAARKELKEYRIYISHLHKQAELNKEELEIAGAVYAREKLLFSRKVISEADHEETQLAYLTRRQSAEQLLVSLSSSRTQEAKLEQNIIDIQMECSREANSLLTSLKAAYNELLVSVENWELSYLFISPADGILSYNEVWQENQNITAGDKVFSVVAAHRGSIIGKVKLPLVGSGKVRPGQRVNISITGYPYMEYGYLTGLVHSVSLLSNEDAYTVTVKLPENLVTSYKKGLAFNGELSGTAEIMTDERSLTGRVLSPLRYLWERHF